MRSRKIKIIAGVLMFGLLVSGCQSTGGDKAAETTVTETPKVTETATPTLEVKETATPTPEPTKEAEPVKAEEVKDDTSDQKDSEQTTEEDQDSSQEKKDNKNDGETENSGDNKAVVQLYEGTYADYRLYTGLEDQTGQRCKLEISDITDTSFDFAVYDITSGGLEGSGSLIFKKNTAKFLPGGEEAVFEGKEYTLHFTFPDNHGAYPIVTDIEVTGFAPLEGICYQNNGIPGHGFS
ncbi:MAG: hypothetical protein PHS82_08770 [Lachnospiraceae bacterium]|nr:hypothetical protein [Lachnospiraceae bacterium]